MCFVEEHVMCSCTAGWREGRLVWSVDHFADRGVENLQVKGEPPAPFAAIRDRLRGEQAAAGGQKAGVDYIFDIPVELAEILTGYRHDTDIEGVSFEVLFGTAPAQRSWWSRLIG